MNTTELLNQLTPIETHGGYLVKRDDLFEVAGVRGGKVRTCLSIARDAIVGLTTAGSRSSPQVNIVANIARALGLPFAAHLPEGDLNEEILLAKQAGAKIIQHRAGYNSVIKARCRDYALKYNYTEVPFGMECMEAVIFTAAQVANIPPEVKRIVMPVGSGMSLCGVLTGLADRGRRDVQVIGVKVGADPVKRISSYAPFGYQEQLTLIDAQVDYAQYIDARLGGVLLDPVYEAKCLRFLQPGDLFWCVGIRQSCINK